MDIQCLVFALIPNRRRHSQMTASAEERYYADQIPLSHLLRLAAATASGIVLLVGIAQI